jgi:hypothetical protein
LGGWEAIVTTCKCGCGEAVKPPNKAYVNKEHQIDHLLAGEAARLNEMQPTDAKRRGGATSGAASAESGRLAEAGIKGALAAKRIADRMRNARSDG